MPLPIAQADLTLEQRPIYEDVYLVEIDSDGVGSRAI
jgi:hypothetical protein